MNISSKNPSARVSKGDLTKIRIMKVATKLFLKEGLYNVTFQQIAKGAGLTQPAIYRHFKDIDDLILESCKHWIQEFKEFKTENFQGYSSARLQLKEFLDRHLIYASKNRDQDALLFGIYYQAMRSKKMLEYYKEIKVRALNKLKMILHLGNIDGSWSLENPDADADTIHSFIVGEIIKTLIEPNTESEQRRTHRVYGHISRSLKIKIHS